MLVDAPTIDIAVIKIKPNRARQKFNSDKLTELKDSIRQFGVLQPVVLTNEGNEVYLIAGERRFRASLQLSVEDPKFRMIPYRWKKDLPLLEQKRIEREENLRRDDLHYSERNALYAEIIALESVARPPQFRGDPAAFKLEELARQTGESPATISVRANFHNELVNRPDLAAKIDLTKTPMYAAMKKLSQMKEAEQAKAAVEIGKIIVTQDSKLGDTRELVRIIPDQSVDMILSDMPFAIPDLGDSMSDATLYTSMMKKTDNLTTAEMDKIMYELAPQWMRILKPSSYMILFFGWDCKHFTETYLRNVGFEVDAEPIIWDKKQTTGSFKGYSPAPCYEQMMLAIKPPRTKRMAEPMKKIIEFPPVSKTIRTHPFEKPVGLLSLWIKQCTNVGDVVHDPFAGTLSTGLAAMELRRTIIAHELDPGHYYIGLKRAAELEARLAKV